MSERMAEVLEASMLQPQADKLVGVQGVGGNMHHFQARNYSYVFNFEQDFEHSVIRSWMEQHWVSVCGWASGIYMLLIWGGQAWMSNRQPFQLRGALTCWNVSLAIFSIMGAARTLPEFIHTFSTQGFYHSLCIPSFIERDRVSGFWTWMFVISKVPELGDTVFIVLRKQPLIFLHWYHHVTVLIYCWYSFSEYTAPARWFIVMNFIVHSMMYTYYAFRALRYRVPKWIAMVITSSQLVQMVIGCIVNYMAYQFKQNGMECGVSNTNLKLSLIMYTSYFVLFARFFYNTYFCNTKGKSEKIASKGSATEKVEIVQGAKDKEVEEKEDTLRHRENIATFHSKPEENCNGLFPPVIPHKETNTESKSNGIISKETREGQEPTDIAQNESVDKDSKKDD